MAKSKKKSSKPSKPAKKPAAKPAPRKRAAPKSIASADDVKRMARAPGDYEDTARKFADTLDEIGFRAPISAAKMRSQVAKGERLAKKAAAIELKFTQADRERIVAESTAYKTMLSNWRSVQARMPDEPTLADAFQWMVEWMSVQRSDDSTPTGGGTPT